MATVQTDRILRLTTTLEKDFLLLESFTVEESLSRPFSIKAGLLHDEGDATDEVPTIIDPSKLLGKPMVIEVEQSDEATVRYFHGIVNRFSQGVREGNFTVYDVEIVPAFWLLTQRFQSRIFQQISVPEILRKVLEGINVKFSLQGTFEPRNYCVQYRESDFNFASRLMEEEGIYYYFVHDKNGHTMVIANTPDGHIPTDPEEIPFILEIEGESTQNAILSWDSDHEFQSGKVTYWDHNFQLHTKKLEYTRNTLYSHSDNDKLEVYDYPGGYARLYDGISPGGGEQESELGKIFAENAKKAAIAMQEIDCRFTRITGSSTSAALKAGARFKFTKHPAAEGEYVITSVRHSVSQSPSYRTGIDSEQPFTNTFTCIPHRKIPTTQKPAPPFRPPRVTPKPVVAGSQTAIVVGPPGEEIFTDKYGRVKVQFHWDREGRNDEGSSCWMRVAQSWAGNQWGTMFIPRINMEVVVSFLEGDPDQPIITGCVYNPMAMPPYELPEHKTRSVIKTNSSKYGRGYNEIRFEDKAGEEQIYVHAQRNFDTRIGNDSFEIVKNERHVITDSNQYVKTKGDHHNELVGTMNEKIGGSKSEMIQGSVDKKVGNKYAADVGGEIHLKAGMKVVIEAGAQISLKAGGSFIDIGPAGIAISGTMVLINSGGAAGVGSGVSTTTPTAPTEADESEAGKEIREPEPPPPPPSNAGVTAGSLGAASSMSSAAKAAALEAAAQSGAPTVDPSAGSQGGTSGGQGGDNSPAGGTSGATAGDQGSQSNAGGTGGAAGGAAPAGSQGSAGSAGQNAGGQSGTGAPQTTGGEAGAGAGGQNAGGQGGAGNAGQNFGGQSGDAGQGGQGLSGQTGSDAGQNLGGQGGQGSGGGQPAGGQAGGSNAGQSLGGGSTGGETGGNTNR